MIEKVHIENLGVIESADLELGAGMNALTGETGAGKTMALTSLQLLMGGKADSMKVRAGATNARVEGTFVVREDSPARAIVEEAGGSVDVEDGKAVIYVSRTVPAEGRSTAHAGGRRVPMSVLHDLAEHLVTVHGQSDQLRLRSANEQLKALDAFGGERVATARANYDAAYRAHRAAKAALEEFRRDAKAAGAERLSLEALVNRVDAVKPQEGEEEELRAEAMRLDNVESLREAMSAARSALEGDERTVLNLTEFARTELERASSDDASLGELAKELRQVSAIANDVAAQLRHKLGDFEADPERLNAIHERRADLTRLQRDLAMDIPEILVERDRAEQRLLRLDDPQAMDDKLSAALSAARRDVIATGTTLTEARSEAASELGALVSDELHSLSMKDATFSVAVTPTDVPTPTGMDTCEFLLAAHLGSKPLPLSATASGGEISRIMLALEVTLARGNMDPDRTFIFDEIDAGIGGSTAISVGERLARLSRSCQTIVVTHLAQVAAYANEHVVVEKRSDSETTATDVVHVAGAQREAELARMLSGHADSGAARAHAAELLASAVVR